MYFHGSSASCAPPASRMAKGKFLSEFSDVLGTTGEAARFLCCNSSWRQRKIRLQLPSGGGFRLRSEKDRALDLLPQCNRDVPRSMGPSREGAEHHQPDVQLRVPFLSVVSTMPSI